MDLDPETVNRRSTNLAILLAKYATAVSSTLSDDELTVVIPIALLKFLATFYACKGTTPLVLEDEEKIIGTISRLLRQELVAATVLRKKLNP